MYFFRAVHGFSACAEVSVGFEVNPYPFPRNAFRGVSLFFQYILTDLVNDNFGKGLFVTGSPSFIPVFLLHQFGYGLPSVAHDKGRHPERYGRYLIPYDQYPIILAFHKLLHQNVFIDFGCNGKCFCNFFRRLNVQGHPFPLVSVDWFDYHRPSDFPCCFYSFLCRQADNSPRNRDPCPAEQFLGYGLVTGHVCGNAAGTVRQGSFYFLIVFSISQLNNASLADPCYRNASVHGGINNSLCTGPRSITGHQFPDLLQSGIQIERFPGAEGICHLNSHLSCFQTGMLFLVSEQYRIAAAVTDLPCPAERDGLTDKIQNFQCTVFNNMSQIGPFLQPFLKSAFKSKRTMMSAKSRQQFQDPLIKVTNLHGRDITPLLQINNYFDYFLMAVYISPGIGFPFTYLQKNLPP